MINWTWSFPLLNLLQCSHISVPPSPGGPCCLLPCPVCVLLNLMSCPLSIICFNIADFCGWLTLRPIKDSLGLKTQGMYCVLGVCGIHRKSHRYQEYMRHWHLTACINILLCSIVPVQRDTSELTFKIWMSHCTTIPSCCIFWLLKIVDVTVLWGLQFYHYFTDQKKEGHGGVSLVYRSLWKPSKGKKVEAAMKILKSECTDKYLKVMNILENMTMHCCCRINLCFMQ